MNINITYAILVILVLAFISVFYTAGIYVQEMESFCKEHGFQGVDMFNNSRQCLRIEGDVVFESQRIRCDTDFLSVITFRNPYRGCKIWKVMA